MKYTAKQIALMLNGTIEGNPEASVFNISKIEEAQEGSLAFIANEKYEHYLAETKASIVLVSKEIKTPQNLTATLIRVEDPYRAFAQLLEAYQKMMEKPVNYIKEQPHFIAKTAKVSDKSYIGAFSYIAEGVVIEDGVQIFPNSYIGNHVIIKKGSIIYSGVKIYSNCEIGEQVIIHAGAVIGADGFGFAPQEDGSLKKVPQLGKVIIEDHVEIGANTTIDRATMGDTHISKNVKIDNLVQIAHNVKVDAHTAIAAQAGISGSTQIGKRCIIGGQAGIVGHLKLADGTRINAQSGLTKSVKTENTDWSDSPAFDYKKALRSQVVYKRLPDLEARVRELEEKISRLSADNNK